MLDVAGEFTPTSERHFSLDSSAAAFVDAVEFAAGSAEQARWQSVPVQGNDWVFDCTGGCRVRYRMRLLEAARALDSVDTAIAAGEVVFAPPSTWLLAPNRRVNGEIGLRVSVPDGLQFLTAFACARGEEQKSGCEYQAPASLLDRSSFAAFGALGTRAVQRGGSQVVLGVASAQMPFDVNVAARWLEDSLGAVSSFYQEQLPAPRALVLMLRGSGGPTRGKTLSAGGPAILLRVGDELNAQTTGDDWVLAHELLHVNFPDIGRSHAWLSEGLASYVEPLARARAGLLEPTVLWRDLIEGLPQGLPEAGDQGLDNTPTWGRIYWGGTLFCLVADVTIRERTHNQRSLDDALRAIAATGAQVEEYWTLPRIWKVGDQATGTTVLAELYERMALRPEPTDLDALYLRLGVKLQGQSVVFDDNAPLAEIRRSLTAPDQNRKSSAIDETKFGGERSSP